MARRTDLITKRNRAVCDTYRKLSAVRERNVSKYSTDYILMKLEDMYFLDPATSWNIIRDEPEGGYVIVEDTQQLDIFKDSNAL